jgi:hypothetical protein
MLNTSEAASLMESKMIYIIWTNDANDGLKVSADSHQQAEAIFSAAHPETDTFTTAVDSSQFLDDETSDEGTLTAASLGQGYNHNGRFYPASQWDLIAL